MMKKADVKTAEALYAFDRKMAENRHVLCGVDEAGRGPLAGDVYAAAVVLDPQKPQLVGLNDSKKMTEKRREALYPLILESSLAYCVASATVAEIEQYNILQATMLAMQRAVMGLGISPELVLVDGNRLPQLPYSAQAVVKGDGTSASIAAASILAKVTRDRKMCELAKQYPQYGFEKHKGYGIKAHYAAILEHGPSPVHRLSFLKKLYENNN